MLNKKYTKIISDSVLGNSRDKQDFVESGFKLLDKSLNGGMRPGCCYLFAGLEKSGKSSFLFNVINERIMSGNPTGMISTEMELSDLTTRLISIVGLDTKDISGSDYWRRHMETYFNFYGKDELVVGTKYNFDKFITAIDEMEKEKIDLVIIDNLTTLGAEAGDYKILGSIVNRLITHVKDKKMAVIFVVHVKNDTSFRESPEGIKKLIKEGKQDEIFNESITVINRPTLKDVYGGGQALSQVSGGVILLWRPFQKYDSPKFQRMGLLIIDSHRFGRSCDLPVEYDGQTGKFWTIEK